MDIGWIIMALLPRAVQSINSGLCFGERSETWGGGSGLVYDFDCVGVHVCIAILFGRYYRHFQEDVNEVICELLGEHILTHTRVHTHIQTPPPIYIL